MVFPIFFSLSLNFAEKLMIRDIKSALGLVFADWIQLLYLGLKKKIQSIWPVLTIWWCPCVKSPLVLFKSVFATTSTFSWQNSVSLCPASFCSARPNLPVTPGMSWLPTFAFQSPVMNRTSFVCVCVCVCVCVLVLGGLLGLHAATAKSFQSCPTLCDPIDGSPPGSTVPGTLQARTVEWVAISFFNAWKWKVKVKSLSRVRLFVTPWTAAY